MFISNTIELELGTVIREERIYLGEDRFNVYYKDIKSNEIQKESVGDFNRWMNSVLAMNQKVG